MFQKFIFICLFLVTSPNIFAQFSDADFFTLDREMRGVRKITEWFRTSGCCGGHWKSTFFYDENGFLLRHVSRHRRRNWHIFYSVRADFRFEYSISDTLLKIKEEEVRNINNNPKVYTLRKFFYNDLGQCIRFEIYSSNFPLHNAGKPWIVGDNFIYKNGLLQSFDRYSFRWRRNSLEPCEVSSANRTIFTYDGNRRIEQTYRSIHTDTAFISPCITIFIYQNGKLTDRIFECNGEQVVFTGGSGAPIRFSSFDKHGNWTRSYFVTGKGKILRSERRIRYW